MQALALAPEDAYTWWDYAKSLESGRTGMSETPEVARKLIKVYERILKLNPPDDSFRLVWIAWQNIAELTAGLGDFDTAIAAEKHAIEHVSEGSAWNRLLVFYRKKLNSLAWGGEDVVKDATETISKLSKTKPALAKELTDDILSHWKYISEERAKKKQ